jgi:23S rRNA (cytidine1920-2'-O)/16S rRNA (cytidine1409-2'-O)-methyltransferase
MTAATRRRLDQLLVDRGLVESRNVARGLILAGLVSVDGRVVDKAGTAVLTDAEVHIKSLPRFVSRAGEKLAHALDVFDVDVSGARALDVGSSTGGFVDCLLQSGVVEIIAVDVGYGLIDMRLRTDSRVHLLERTNARRLRPEQLPYIPDLLTVDVSFISLHTVLPAVVACMTPSFRGLLLVKPQFEAGPKNVGKGGVVRDPLTRTSVLRVVTGFCVDALGLAIRGVTDSGHPGARGNREYVVWVERGGVEGLSAATLEEEIVATVMPEEGIG